MAGLSTTFNAGVAITTSDTVDIVHPAGRAVTEAIMVGAAGTVTLVFQSGLTVQVTAVAGQILPVAVKRVNATGTAATGLVALYSV